MKKIIFAIFILLFISSSVYSFPQYTGELVNGLISYWNMNEASGNILDSIGGHTGVISDATRLGDGNGITSQGGGANSGNGLLFVNGAGGYVITDNIPALPSGASPRSISCWIKPTDYADGGALGQIVGYGDFASNSDLFFLSTLISTQSFYLWAYPSSYQSSHIVSLGIWQHVVVTYDGSKIIIYKNGVVDGGSGATTLATLVDGNNGMFKFASDERAGQGRFVGSMDEVEVWNRTLSANEVNLIYKQAKNSKGIENLTNLLISKGVPFGLSWCNE